MSRIRKFVTYRIRKNVENIQTYRESNCRGHSNPVDRRVERANIDTHHRNIVARYLTDEQTYQSNTLGINCNTFHLFAAAVKSLDCW